MSAPAISLGTERAGRWGNTGRLPNRLTAEPLQLYGRTAVTAPFEVAGNIKDGTFIVYMGGPALPLRNMIYIHEPESLRILNSFNAV